MAVASVTDQAGESQGGFQALLDKCGVDHRLAGAYHPQANGLTECANQTLIKSLVKMTNEDPLNLTNKFLQYGWPYRATRQVVIVADANDRQWTKRVADLGKWT
ncbi:hypothetical protein ABBQ38_013365 [Trebouxia sp. C0009 RCD-2024]